LISTSGKWGTLVSYSVKVTTEGSGQIANRGKRRRHPDSSFGGPVVSVRTLVVEDEFMIGLDVSQQLADAGFKVVGPATSVRKALSLVARRGCDIAVLDINLGGETSELIARKLRASGKPFVALTGYSTDNLRPSCHDATTLTKPPRIGDLVAALRQAITMGMERTPALIWSSLPDGRIEYLNPHWLACFDLRIKNAAGDGWTVIIHPHDRDELLAKSDSVRTGTLYEATARRRRYYGNSAGILNRYRDGEIGAVGLAKKVDQSLSARHLLDQGDQDRYKGAGSPARSAPGRPEQPMHQAHPESGRRRFELPAGYPSTRAEPERKISFAPGAVKVLRVGLKITRTEVADEKGQGIPDPCSFHVSADAWRGKTDFSKRLVETTSLNISRAPRTAMSGCAPKEL
jgi:CheY-like chemotaxis protein